MNIELTPTEKCIIIQALYDMRANLNRKLKEHDPSDPQGCSSLAIACVIKELNVANSALQKINQMQSVPIGDARITFDSKKQRDEFKASLEKDGRTKVKKNIYKCCKNCKYWTGKDELELERCVKHDHLMWGTADPCKGFEFKEEGEKE